MHTVEGIAVPEAQVASLTVPQVLHHNAVELVQAAIEVRHLLSCGVNFQKGVFALFLQVFIQDLN